MCGAKCYCSKRHRTFGCNNRRLQWRNKPKGYRCGSLYDRGNTNNALCFDGWENDL